MSEYYVKDITKDHYEAFLKDLTELTRKHKITISGCGCCGSPGLSPLYKTENKKSYRYIAQERDFNWLKWSNKN